MAKLLAREMIRESQLRLRMLCPLAYAYCRERFDDDLKHIVHAFKTVRYLYLSPSKVSELTSTAADIDTLVAFPFLTSELIDG